MSPSLILCNNNESFLDLIVMWWKVDFTWQPAHWLDQEEAPKHFPKTNLHQKMGHGLCLVVWGPSDPLQLPESQWNHYIWEVCSANQWDAWKIATPAVGTGQQHGTHSPPQQCLTTCHIMNMPEVERIVLQSFASSSIFTWPLANWLPLLQASQQLFAGKMLPQPGGCRKCFPRLHHIWKHRFFFYATGKNKHFSFAKMCWLSWFLFWLIKMSLSLVMMINIQDLKP